MLGVDAHQRWQKALGMLAAGVGHAPGMDQQPCGMHFGYANGLPREGQDRELARGVLDLDVRAPMIDDQQVDVHAIREGAAHAAQLNIHRAEMPTERGRDQLQAAFGEGQEVQPGERHRQ